MSNKGLKLDVKKTIFVGFAFFLISAFWQAYDKTMPLIMTYRFNMNQTMSGIIMALDNILAVFMLPLFGALSDKTKSRFGRRTVFIFCGTILAIISFIFIPLINNVWFFIGILLITLISMATFRSPAVALMPDVTVKPLRSKANAIINLMGTAGGILVLVLGMVVTVNEENMGNLMPYYIAVCAIMLLGLIIFLLTVKEPKWAKQMQEDTEKYLIDEEAEERETAGGKLTKGQLISLFLILGSVALWYMGYNAVTSKYSLYADEVLNQSYDMTLLIAQAAAIITYVPVGIIASKIGRKKTILAGVAILALSFASASLMTDKSSPIFMTILFALAGIGWATINVNSFPMVVELSKEGDVGKYTGWYYTASMSAQILTPVLSGILMDAFTMKVLFPYAAVCVALAFATMFFVKHGDSKPIKKASALENFDIDD